MKKMNKDEKKPKVLFFDIETSPTLAYVFGRWQVNINSDFILKDTSIICVSYKWNYEDVVHTISIGDNRREFLKDPYSDYYVVEKFLKVLKQADIVVAHNGDKFDYKILKARTLIHGLKPFMVRKVDTLKMSRNLAFPRGNRLGDLAEVLDVHRKTKTDIKWWYNIMTNSCYDSLEEMIYYCENDVKTLEAVYNKLLPHTEASHPNVASLLDIDKTQAPCPRCGSVHTIKFGEHIKSERVFDKYVCSSCDHTFAYNKRIKVKNRNDIPIQNNNNQIKDLPIGVTFDKPTGKYLVRHKGKFIGRYIDLQEAIKVRKSLEGVK